ncbi:MAG TPA: hypothetical protein DDX19_06295 [Rhodopirellula baltica]|uniref:Uncharacterized protein n=1 Tax=Rhodopirellula baltica (strain DSM 10527 / NCIMB 13988 / SH1) TaxID=243090 RepID=Q7UIC8_RHOBA|nr:hypothetical protein RB12621 [Rhodopirellula baltica SH 1]HBE62344.1 hypothetical protein [Rhodopirellula baltica]
MRYRASEALDGDGTQERLRQRIADYSSRPPFCSSGSDKSNPEFFSEMSSSFNITTSTFARNYQQSPESTLNWMHRRHPNPICNLI